jgi:HNH endonuclease
MKRTIKERLLANVLIDPITGCWNWQRGKFQQGYGMIQIDHCRQRAHRVSFSEFVGPIPDGLFVCHRCDNPGCINPSHLFLGTAQDNSSDMVAKGRQATGEENGNARLSDLLVQHIRSEHANGVNGRAISRALGIHNVAVYRVINRQSWKQVS